MAAAIGPERSLRVGYILKMFPRLSETFILNEILGLEEHGADVSVFSLMYPNDGRYHGNLARLRLTVEHVVRDKAEALWERLAQPEEGSVPSWERWGEARAFLARHGIPKDLDLLLRAVSIATRVRTLEIEHLHAHFATIATQVAALVNILTGVPFSFTSHAKDIFRNTVKRDLYAELVDRSAFNITVSDYNRRFIIDHTPGVNADKIIRLYNGIDLGFFDAPEERPPVGEIPHLVSVGRLVPKKGFDGLLVALAEWKRQGRPFRATIIGAGEDELTLRDMCTNLQLDGQVTFTGGLPQESVRTAMESATLAVLNCVPDEIGNQDALPTTLLEALAMGIPIVSTRLAGVPEIVGDVGGELAEPGNPDELSGAMIRMLDRIAAGEYSSEAARSRAAELFDRPTNVDRLHEYFLKSARGELA